jgi:hypothetical protein
MNRNTTLELLGDACALQAMETLRAGERMSPALQRLLEAEEQALPVEFCEGCLKPYPEGTGFATDDDVYLCPACWDEVIHDPDCAVGWFERLRARLGRVGSQFLVHSYQFLVRLRTWLRGLPDRIEAWQPTERQTNICDLWVKTAVICAALYLFIEVGRAFLPGGAASTVLFGGTK